MPAPTPYKIPYGDPIYLADPHIHMVNHTGVATARAENISEKTGAQVYRTYAFCKRLIYDPAICSDLCISSELSQIRTYLKFALHEGRGFGKMLCKGVAGWRGATPFLLISNSFFSIFCPAGRPAGGFF